MNKSFVSCNPATGEKVWEGVASGKTEVDAAVSSCRKAFSSWSKLTFEERVKYLKAFEKVLIENQELLSRTIAEETGKPIWDSKGEVTAMINKIGISIKAYQDRCKALFVKLPQAESHTRHKPHGVVAIFGPFNFPGHLPNGHIVPALLAGNTCVFKPSDLAPKTAEVTLELWKKSGLPDGVIELVQGGKETGMLLASHKGINGLFFTGSFSTGKILLKQFAETPEKILALEMGGNNPFIVWDVADLKTASYFTIQSAFISSGQRCTCARRLIVKTGKEGDAFIQELTQAIGKIKLEEFMGPVISMEAAEKLLTAQNELMKAGGKPLIEMKRVREGLPFLSPGLMDVTGIKCNDEELFGPFLQVIRVPDFKAAIREANNTAYGLAAGLLSDKRELYDEFVQEINAGVVSWNTSTTGASSGAPFGGIGHSGNFRPSAYYAADYCAYPVASLEADTMTLPAIISPGITF